MAQTLAAKVNLKILLFFVYVTAMLGCGGPAGPTSSEDRSGTWTISPTLHYSCAAGAVNYSINSITIVDTNPTIDIVVSVGEGDATLLGTFASPNDFSASLTITYGSRSGTATLIGTFTTSTTFTGTIEIDFISNLQLLGCSDQSDSITGTKI